MTSMLASCAPFTLLPVPYIDTILPDNHGEKYQTWEDGEEGFMANESCV